MVSEIKKGISLTEKSIHEVEQLADSASDGESPENAEVRRMEMEAQKAINTTLSFAAGAEKSFRTKGWGDKDFTRKEEFTW